MKRSSAKKKQPERFTRPPHGLKASFTNLAHQALLIKYPELAGKPKHLLAKTVEEPRGGFVMAKQKLFRPNQELPLLAQDVFLRLQAFCSEKRLDRHPEVAVSMVTLCKAVGRGETAVRAALVGLEKAGWIKRLRQGYRKVNRYRLYEESAADREAQKSLEATRQKVAKDLNLAARLTKSLHPKSDA